MHLFEVSKLVCRYTILVQKKISKPLGGMECENVISDMSCYLVPKSETTKI